MTNWLKGGWKLSSTKDIYLIEDMFPQCDITLDGETIKITNTPPFRDVEGKLGDWLVKDEYGSWILLTDEEVSLSPAVIISGTVIPLRHAVLSEVEDVLEELSVTEEGSAVTIHISSSFALIQGGIMKEVSESLAKKLMNLLGGEFVNVTNFSH